MEVLIELKNNFNKRKKIKRIRDQIENKNNIKFDWMMKLKEKTLQQKC